MIFTRIQFWLMLLLIAFAVAMVLLILFFISAFAASPGECDSGERTVESTVSLAEQLQAKLDQFTQQLDAGQAATVTFDESEATSRGQQFLDDLDAPIADLRVCFDPQGPSASGKVEAILGLDISVRISGQPDLSGDHLRIENLDIEVGGVAGFLVGPLEGVIESVINDQLDQIPIEHPMEITFGAGTATLSGTP